MPAATSRTNLSWNQATNSFNLQLFGANANAHSLVKSAPKQVSSTLTKGDPSAPGSRGPTTQQVYDAEFLTRSTSTSTAIPSKVAISSRSTNQPRRIHTQNKLDSFKGSNSTNLLQDANSKQLLVAPSANPNQRVELTNADGSPTHLRRAANLENSCPSYPAAREAR